MEFSEDDSVYTSLSTSEVEASDEEDFEEGFQEDQEERIDAYAFDFVPPLQPHFGGYEYEFVDNVSPNQKCPVCLLPMRDAVQTSDCGQRFCRDCLRSSLPVCPNDRQEIKEEDGFFTDKAWARDILSLRVKCPQSARGCEWIGELRHAEEHEDHCPYGDTQFAACEDNIQRRLLETHLDEECPERIVECAFCQDEFYFIQKQEHEDTYCKRFPLVCENNCGQDGIAREEMADHLAEKCLETIVSCPYTSAGCPFQDKRAYLNDHIEANLDDHLEMTWSCLVNTKQELDSMKDLRHKFHKSEENNQAMAKSLTDCRAQIGILSLAVKKLQLGNIEQKKLIKDMEKKTAREIEKLQSKVLHTEGRVSREVGNATRRVAYCRVDTESDSEVVRKAASGLDWPFVTGCAKTTAWEFRAKEADQGYGKENGKRGREVTKRTPPYSGQRI